MIKKKLLILGAKGMLGQALVKEFLAKVDYEITAWDKEDLDILDNDKLKEKVFLLKPQIIINAVAHNGVDKIETEEAEFLAGQKINGEVIKNLGAIAKELDAVLIHYSSDYVFDGSKKEGYAEEEQPQPISKYGQTKAEGEKNLLASGARFYLIRLSKLFSNIPSGPTSKKSFVETMLNLYNQGKREMELVDEEISSPTYAPDLAVFTRRLLEEQKPWGIYHGANLGSCTWYEFGQAIFNFKKYDVCIVPVPSEKYPRPALRPAYSVLLNTKMPPQRPWQEALAECLS